MVNKPIQKYFTKPRLISLCLSMGFRSKNILVTGGAGFIGSHLCRKLLERGDYVICLDNFFTGRREHISDLFSNKNFEVIRHDIIDPIYIEINEIYNLAQPASPIHYQYNPIKTIKTGYLGISNMLGLARRTGSKILQASTSEIYGDPEVHPQNEAYCGKVNITGPRACYDESKRIAETLCYEYHRAHKVDVRVARIFNTYGPQMDPEDGRVVSNFIIQALKKEALSIYGDGSQTRSFCYVDDLVSGLLHFMDNQSFIGPLNIGNDQEFTIRELAEKIIHLLSSSSSMIFKPLPQDDPIRRRPDLNLAKEKIQYNPSISLEEGLKKTIEYFRNLLEKRNCEYP